MGAVAMPKHIIRLVLLLVGLLALGLFAKSYFTDSSFYRFGHFRSDVVVELAAGVPQIRGTEYCKACHVERHAQWSAASHKAVKCEVCHGAARDHPANGKLPIPEDTVKLCTLCHEALPARPDSQPQIVVLEHPYPHDAPIQCKTCHNPHAPAIGGAPKVDETIVDPAVDPAPEATSEALEEAQSVPAKVMQCQGCHGASGEGVGSFPALAGMGTEEFATQIGAYRSGDRSDPMMSGIAKGLSDEEIAALADYYASLPAQPAE